MIWSSHSYGKYSILKEYAEKACEKQSGLSETAEAALLLLLDKTESLSEKRDKSAEVYRKILSFAEENADRAVSLSDLSENLGICERQLGRIAKRFGEKSVKDILVKKRLEKIEFLIKNGDCDAQSLAMTAGFYTAELLRKFYRYHTGKNLPLSNIR